MEIYLDSRLDADSILGFGFEHVCIATGARWRRDRVNRQHVVPFPIDPGMPLCIPDNIMEGNLPTGGVVIAGDNHYHMGGVLAALLAIRGCEVSLITPAAHVSDWTRNTLEQAAIHQHLAGLGVEIVLKRGVTAIGAGHAVSNCLYTGTTGSHGCDAVVRVASRQGEDRLFRDLAARQET